jgi:hypothetical protein
MLKEKRNEKKRKGKKDGMGFYLVAHLKAH